MRDKILIAIIISAMAGVMSGCSNPYYNGPKSDHFDGSRFQAPEPVADKSFFTVLKWKLTSKREPWETPRPVKVNAPASRVDGNDLRVTFVGHSTVLLQSNGLNILTDPIWSQRASPLTWFGPKRVTPPGIHWASLPTIDAVVISHSHYDHLDLPTIKNLAARDNPLFIVPLGVDTIIRNAVPKARLKVLDWHQSTDIGKGDSVTLVPSYHWSARTPFDRNKSLWGGYVLNLAGEKIYFVGDTGFGSGEIFDAIGQKYGPIRLALIPIGAYEPRWFMKEAHVNPAEAVAIHQAVKAQHSMAIHFGTFRLSDEGLYQPVTDLELTLKAHIFPDNVFRALDPGQAWDVPPLVK